MRPFIILCLMSIVTTQSSAWAKCQAAYQSENTESKVMTGVTGVGAGFLGSAAVPLLLAGPAGWIGLGMVGGIAAIYGNEAKSEYDYSKETSRSIALLNEADNLKAGEQIKILHAYLLNKKVDIELEETTALVSAMNSSNIFCKSKERGYPLREEKIKEFVEWYARNGDKERLAFRKVLQTPRTSPAPIEERSIAHDPKADAEFEAKLQQQKAAESFQQSAN